MLFHVLSLVLVCVHFFFFHDTATPEIYTLSLHDALPISICGIIRSSRIKSGRTSRARRRASSPESAVMTRQPHSSVRLEEHTSELQSRQYLVCRLLLEKKKKKQNCNKLL